MDYDTWIDTYKPIQNTHPGQSPSYDGTMFETTDLDLIRTFPEDRIWTLLITDDTTVISNGVHFVNREGYFVTEVPFTGPDDFLEVILFDGSEFSDAEDEDLETTAF